MAELLFSAVTTAFMMVRLFRGPWRRNPQYLAAAICGAIVAALVLHAVWPAMDDSFVVGGITGIAGSWAAMTLFDKALGAV
jgi:glycerol uptake facilitator-like aquaporin